MSDFHEPVNIGNPREMTIKQFAEEIIRITGTKSKIEYRPLPVDDPKVRQPDIGRARKFWAGSRKWSSKKESPGRSIISGNGSSGPNSAKALACRAPHFCGGRLRDKTGPPFG